MLQSARERQELQLLCLQRPTLEPPRPCHLSLANCRLENLIQRQLPLKTWDNLDSVSRTKGPERSSRGAWTRSVRAMGGSSVLRIDVAVADRGGAVLGRLTMIRPAPRQTATTVTTS